MAPRLDMIGVVVEDLGRALAFYRELGLEFPDDAEAQGHVEAPLPGGLRFALDTRADVHKFDPDWKAATGGSGRIGFAFLVESPDEVDSTYERLTSHLDAGDRLTGLSRHRAIALGAVEAGDGTCGLELIGERDLAEITGLVLPRVVVAVDCFLRIHRCLP